MEIKQSTVNLIIVMAAIVVAAGAWSTPMMIAQTGHSLEASISASTTSINANVDNEVGEVQTSVGGGSILSEANCSIDDILVAILLNQDAGIVCDEDVLETNYIKSSSNFKNFNDNFEVETLLLQNFASELIPFRECADVGIGTANLLADDDDIVLGQNKSNVKISFLTGGGAGAFPAAPTCLHALSFSDHPQNLKAITIENEDADDHIVRLQLGIGDDADDAANNNDCDNFATNVVFDSMVEVSAGHQTTISGDLMVTFPPDDFRNICAQVADEDGSGANTYQIWLTVQDVGFPISIFQFAPDPDFALFAFDKFGGEGGGAANFGDLCGLRIQVDDSEGTGIPNIPIEILGPFVPTYFNGDNFDIFGAVQADRNNTTDVANDENVFDNFALTDANGLALFDPADANAWPTGFYVIDVNVASLLEDDFSTAVTNTAPDPLFSFAFPDQEIDCTNGITGGAPAKNAAISDDVIITVVLTSFSADKDVVVTTFDDDGTILTGIPVSFACTDFFGTAQAKVGQDSDANGQALFEDLKFGACDIEVNTAAAATASGGAALNNSAKIGLNFIFIDQFSPQKDFIGIFIA